MSKFVDDNILRCQSKKGRGMVLIILLTLISFLINSSYFFYFFLERERDLVISFINHVTSMNKSSALVTHNNQLSINK